MLYEMALLKWEHVRLYPNDWHEMSLPGTLARGSCAGKTLWLILNEARTWALNGRFFVTHNIMVPR